MSCYCVYNTTSDLSEFSDFAKCRYKSVHWVSLHCPPGCFPVCSPLSEHLLLLDHLHPWSFHLGLFDLDVSETILS